MSLSPLQSIVALILLVALAFCPLIYRPAARRDAVDAPQPEPVKGVLSARAALGRHMYGEAVGWERKAMDDYDQSLPLQAMWKAEAGYKLAGR